MSKRKTIIHAGQRFGYLEVIEESGKDKFNNYLYKCKCFNCGKEKVIRASHLLRGNSRSCGCLMRTSTYKRSKHVFTGESLGPNDVVIQQE